MTKLSDIALIYTGYNPRSSASKKLQAVEFIVPKCLDSGWSESITVNIPEKYCNYLRSGDILVKSRGDVYSAKVFMAENRKRHYVASSTLLVVRPTNEMYSSFYISQIINLDTAQQTLKRSSDGKVASAISPSNLGDMDCPFVPVEQQMELEKIGTLMDEYKTISDQYIKLWGKFMQGLRQQIIKGVK